MIWGTASKLVFKLGYIIRIYIIYIYIFIILTTSKKEVCVTRVQQKSGKSAERYDTNNLNVLKLHYDILFCQKSIFW